MLRIKTVPGSCFFERKCSWRKNPARGGFTYDDSRWEQAKPYKKKLVPEAVSPGNLKPRNIPYMYRKKRSFQNVMDLKESDYTQKEWEAFLNEGKELAIPAHTKVTVQLDAGEEMTGYIRAAFSGGEGAAVSLLYAEAYVQEGVAGPEHIPVKADRRDKVKGHLQGYKDIYHVSGNGTRKEQEIYEPYWFRTFASGHVKTPVGDIRVSWKKENGVFKIEHEVPQDIQVIQ